MNFRSGSIQYTFVLHQYAEQLGLLWLIEYIAANQKRVKSEIPGLQEWVFSLDTKHRGVLKVFSRGVAFRLHRKLHFTFKFTVLDYTGPPVTLVLEKGVLMTQEEFDAQV